MAHHLVDFPQVLPQIFCHVNCTALSGRIRQVLHSAALRFALVERWTFCLDLLDILTISFMHNTCRENLSKSGDSDNFGSLCTQSGVSIPTSSLPFSENCVNLLLSAQGTPCTNILLIQRMRSLTARAVEGQNPTDTNWLDFFTSSVTICFAWTPTGGNDM